MTIVVVTLLTVFGLLAAALLRGRRRWAARTAFLRNRIGSVAGRAAEKVDFTELGGLPPPVERYFRHVLQEGQPLIGRVHLHQRGGFRPRPAMAAWSVMEAEQWFTVSPRAFLWDARVRMLPGVSVNVRDAYCGGRGWMTVKLLAVLPLIDAAEDARLSAAALQRYLAESVWFPTALLPGQGVVWEARGDRRARATLSDADVTVSLEFIFNDRDEVESVFSAGRYREVDGGYELTPWQGWFGPCIDSGGYLIPSSAEVGWLLPDGVYRYWMADTIIARHEC